MSDADGKNPAQTAVYRVTAANGDGWHVFSETSAEPVATFREKTEALSYAMSLARGRASPHMLLGARSRPIRSGLGVAHRAFNA